MRISDWSSDVCSSDLTRQKLADAPPALLPGTHAMHAQRLLHQRADRHARVQRREGVLEDELQVAAQAAHLPLRQGADVTALVEHLPGCRADEAHQQARQRRLRSEETTSELQSLMRIS